MKNRDLFWIINVFLSITTMLIILGGIVILGTELKMSWKEITGEKQRIESTCEHEYVMTSEYSRATNSFRIISKCVKCGKKI